MNTYISYIQVFRVCIQEWESTGIMMMMVMMMMMMIIIIIIIFIIFIIVSIIDEDYWWEARLPHLLLHPLFCLGDVVHSTDRGAVGEPWCFSKSRAAAAITSSLLLQLSRPIFFLAMYLWSWAPRQVFFSQFI